MIKLKLIGCVLGLIGIAAVMAYGTSVERVQAELAKWDSAEMKILTAEQKAKLYRDRFAERISNIAQPTKLSESQITQAAAYCQGILETKDRHFRDTGTYRYMNGVESTQMVELAVQGVLTDEQKEEMAWRPARAPEPINPPGPATRPPFSK